MPNTAAKVACWGVSIHVLGDVDGNRRGSSCHRVSGKVRVSGVGLDLARRPVSVMLIGRRSARRGCLGAKQCHWASLRTSLSLANSWGLRLEVVSRNTAGVTTE